MKVILFVEKKKVKELTTGKLEMSTRASSEMTRDKGKVFTDGLMEAHTKANGLEIECMELAVW